MQSILKEVESQQEFLKNIKGNDLDDETRVLIDDEIDQLDLFQKEIENEFVEKPQLADAGYSQQDLETLISVLKKSKLKLVSIFSAAFLRFWTPNSTL